MVLVSARLGTLLVLAGAALAAVADEVVLRNGDRIRGEITSLADGKLVLRTDYAGEIALRWREVASLSTTGPVSVMRAGARTPLRGTLQSLYGGRLLLVAPDGTAQEISLEEIAHLNPRPWESGIGVAYAGRITLAAAFTRGNTEDERIDADGEFTARARDYRYGLSARVERDDEPEIGMSTAWIANANYDRFVETDRFVYVRGSLEHDRAKDVAQRASAGGGYGAELASGRASLTVRGGLDYVTLDRYAAANERYPALGWGVKVGYPPWFHEHEGGSGTWRTPMRCSCARRQGCACRSSRDWAPARSSTSTGSAGPRRAGSRPTRLCS